MRAEENPSFLQGPNAKVFGLDGHLTTFLLRRPLCLKVLGVSICVHSECLAWLLDVIWVRHLNGLTTQELPFKHGILHLAASAAAAVIAYAAPDHNLLEALFFVLCKLLLRALLL